MIARARLALLTLIAVALGYTAVARDTPVAVGDSAPGVTLPSYEGGTVELGDAFARGTTVVAVLRGFPGYQCPLCSRQASQYLGLSDRFAQAGVNVLLVYPGDAGGLDSRAEEFLAGRQLANPVKLVLDPDYAFTNAYGLRWDAPRETAYPATFVVRDGQVVWANVSSSHGGRVSANEALAAATN